MTVADTTRLLGAATALLLSIAGAAAQVPSLPAIDTTGRAGSARQLLPELQPGAPLPRLTFPEVRPPGDASDTGGPRFLLREIRIRDVTTLDEAEISTIATPFIGRNVSADDLETLRRRLTLAYVERGFVTSGVLLPDQDVADGIVTYQAVEGVVAEIDVGGVTWLDPDYVGDRLRRALGQPLHIGSIERQIQILLQDPSIERLNVDLEPTTVLGRSRLRAVVTETAPYYASATLANSQPATVGEFKAELQGGVRNLLGRGDLLTMRYGRGRGLEDGGGSFSVPLFADDTTLTAKMDLNEARVIESPFRGLRIENRSNNFELALARPFYRTPSETLTLGFSLAHRTGRTQLLSEPFSFNQGVESGRSRVIAVRLFQDWLDRQPDRVVALRSTFSRGVDVLDATMSGVEPDGVFTSWVGQAQVVQRIFGDVQAVLRADVQWSSDPLLSAEKLSIGGATSVRGYRESEINRDNGYAVSVELRIPVVRYAIPGISQGDSDGWLRLIPFVDYGAGWNVNGPTPSPSTLASVGLGLSWDVGARLRAQVFYSHRLRDLGYGNDTLQDRGIHLRITSQLY